MFYLWQISSVLSMVEREPPPQVHFLQTRYGRFDTRSFIPETHPRVKRRCFSYGLLHGEGGQGWLHFVRPKDSGKVGMGWHCRLCILPVKPRLLAQHWCCITVYFAASARIVLFRADFHVWTPIKASGVKVTRRL